MLTRFEMEEKGFIPKKNYRLGQAFPAGFSLPEKASNDDWKKIPLYIQVRYEYESKDGYHYLIQH